jgi:hypothetical protein
VVCTPGNEFSNTSREYRVMIQVMGYDAELMYTRALIYHKTAVAYGNNIQLLGYVDVDVSDVLNSNWYSRYRYKKRLKMQLMNEHSLYDQREMQMADVQLSAYNELKELAKIQKITRTNLNLTIKQIVRSKKGVLSLIAKDELLNDLYSLVNAEYESVNAKQKVIFEINKIRQNSDDDCNNVYSKLAMIYIIINKVIKQDKENWIKNDYLEDIQELLCVTTKESKGILDYYYTILDNVNKNMLEKISFEHNVLIKNITKYYYIHSKLNNDLAYLRNIVNIYEDYLNINLMTDDELKIKIENMKGIGGTYDFAK